MISTSTPPGTPLGTGSRPPAVPTRSCCCPARPAVLVIMPPVPARPHETDLLLCGHHFRASQRALAYAGAAIRSLRD